MQNSAEKYGVTIDDMIEYDKTCIKQTLEVEKSQKDKLSNNTVVEDDLKTASPNSTVKKYKLSYDKMYNYAAKYNKASPVKKVTEIQIMLIMINKEEIVLIMYLKF